MQRMYDDQGALYIPPSHGRIRFSKTETLHIIVGVAVLIFAFYMSFAHGNQLTLDESLYYFTAATVAVVTGFLLHELAHKFLAQKYGAWAEFRVFPLGLMFALFFALLSGIVFAAPGAVYIQGRITKEQNGIISLAGPGLNLIFGLACIALLFVLPLEIIFIVGWINLFLAAFNLIPFGPLDGAKVFRWNPWIYVLVMGAAIASLVGTWYLI